MKCFLIHLYDTDDFILIPERDDTSGGLFT